MNHSMAFDERDREVIRRIEERSTDVVALKELKRLFETYTDVKRPSTVKRRIRTLTAHDDFQEVGFQRWRWTGELDERGEEAVE